MARMLPEQSSLRRQPTFTGWLREPGGSPPTLLNLPPVALNLQKSSPRQSICWRLQIKTVNNQTPIWRRISLIAHGAVNLIKTRNRRQMNGSGRWCRTCGRRASCPYLPRAIPVVGPSPVPVSYTHLDVYKRQF